MGTNKMHCDIPRCKSCFSRTITAYSKYHPALMKATVMKPNAKGFKATKLHMETHWSPHTDFDLQRTVRLQDKRTTVQHWLEEDRQKIRGWKHETVECFGLGNGAWEKKDKVVPFKVSLAASVEERASSVHLTLPHSTRRYKNMDILTLGITVRMGLGIVWVGWGREIWDCGRIRIKQKQTESHQNNASS